MRHPLPTANSLIFNNRYLMAEKSDEVRKWGRSARFFISFFTTCTMAVSIKKLSLRENV
jgi:hypothetical protein